MKGAVKSVFLFSICCLLATALAGCSTVSDKRLEPQSILKFSDVPIPVGLKSLPQKSYSFENAGTRVAVLKYQGRANIDQVINFYKEQMPMYNWSLINIIEYGQRLLNFERENETCIITVQIAGFWNEEVLATVSLGPKSQNISKKSKTPIK
ncbi:MAG TPA: hypothetical protein PL125_01450 [Candidatus Omnitrophota bacterium]|nr:hypothetical protein [Candidatus Omnitrophota bacterium]HPT38851.1 hypothetical protein [Candidatus Omnitrophota bacterium]